MENSLQPAEPTLAKDLVLSLSDTLAATASSHKVYGEPIPEILIGLRHDRTHNLVKCLSHQQKS